LAEGNRTPGRYPIGGQGVPGCAAIRRASRTLRATSRAGRFNETASVVAVIPEQRAVVVALLQCSAKAAWKQMSQDQCRIATTVCTARLFIR